MVWNSNVVVEVAEISAEVFQYVACNPERLPSDQVLYLLFCFPFQHIRRMALCLCTVFCFPLPLPGHSGGSPAGPFAYTSSFYSSSSSSSDSESGDDVIVTELQG